MRHGSFRRRVPLTVSALRGRTRMAASMLLVLALGATLQAFAAPAAQPKELGRFHRDQGAMMLSIVRTDLTDYYYDPSFHGLNLDRLFGRAEETIGAAKSHAEIYAAIANTLLALDDSHTVFIPPAWAAKIETGWFVQMIGDDCRLFAVKPGSDAESLGLKKGDRVLSIDGEAPSRQSLPIMMYDQRLLAPRSRTTLVVEPPGGSSREVVVHPKIEHRKAITTRWDHADQWRAMEDEAYLDRHRLHAMGDDLLIWKMPGFNLMREDVGRAIAKTLKYK